MYPLDPWLGVMGLGVVFGHWLQQQQELSNANQRIIKRLTIVGTVSIALFFILRILTGRPFNYLPIYNKEGVLRVNAFAFETFFLLAKYPPSITFLLWTLGGMCLALAMAYYFQTKEWFQKWMIPVMLFGATPLFFYCTHLYLYGIFPISLGLENTFSLPIAVIVWVLGLIILFPLCHIFQMLKKKYPESPLKYI
ncbi:MAG: hypothetical protein ACFFBD_16810, partial [Candidatus Hodarchaeota archaeon]